MEITRSALTLLHQYGFGVGLSTKSSLIARDASLLGAMQKDVPLRICFSITTNNDALCAKIEPNAALSSKRFEALHALATKGVFTGVWLNPLLPFLTDTEENVKSLIHRTAEAGGKFIVCFFGMTLREGNREYFYRALDRDFPGVKKQYAAAFGLDYECPSPKAEALYRLFIRECDECGLLYRFRDINSAMLAGQARQLSLFD